MKTFETLPFEIHEKLSDFLQPQERQTVSHICQKTLEIYRPLAYDECVCTLDSSPDEQPPGKVRVPLPILNHPEKASWFPNDKVKQLIVEIVEEPWNDSDEDDQGGQYNQFLSQFALSPKDYPSVTEIHFPTSDKMDLSKKFLDSNMCASIHEFSISNKPFISLPMWIKSEENKANLQDLSSLINYTNITKVIFKNHENITDENLPSNLVFPLLECATINGYTGIQFEYPVPQRNLIVPLLTIFSKSPLLRRVEIISLNLTDEEFTQYLTEGILKLSPTIKECKFLNIAITEPEINDWPATVPDEESIIDIPQITCLAYLNTNFSVFNKFRFPRARVTPSIPLSVPRHFFSSKQALSCVNYLQAKISFVEHIESLIRIIPSLINVEEAQIEFSIDWKFNNDKIPSALHRLHLAQNIAQDLKTTPFINRDDLHDHVTKILAPEDKHLVDTFTSLYHDPIEYLSDAMKYYNDNDHEPIFTLMCLQEALFASLFKLKKLRMLGFSSSENDYITLKSEDISLYQYFRQYPNIALQRLVIGSDDSPKIKELILSYKGFNDLEGEDDSPIIINDKTGDLVDGKAFVVSDCLSIVPRPCSIYFYCFSLSVSYLAVKFVFNYGSEPKKSIDLCKCSDLEFYNIDPIL